MQYYPAKSSFWSMVISKGNGHLETASATPAKLATRGLPAGITCMARAVVLGVICLETTVWPRCVSTLSVLPERPTMFISLVGWEGDNSDAA